MTELNEAEDMILRRNKEIERLREALEVAAKHIGPNDMSGWERDLLEALTGEEK